MSDDEHVDPVEAYKKGLARGRREGFEDGYREAWRWMNRLNADVHDRRTARLFTAMREVASEFDQEFDSSSASAYWRSARESAEYELQAGLREAYAAPVDDDEGLPF